MAHNRVLTWMGLGLLVGTAACSLPSETQNACLNQSDCLAGYACVNELCTPPSPEARTTGDGTGGTSGGTTGGTGSVNWASVTPVSSDSLVVCADANTLSAWAHASGPATHLAFVIQPVDDVLGQAMCPIAVAALDDNNAIATSFTAAVSLSASSGNPTGGVTASAVNGVAVFTNVRMGAVGTGQVLAASQGALHAQSSAFKTHAVSWQAIGGWDYESTVFYDASRDNIYAFNYTGDYRSSDGGASWQLFGTGLQLPIPGVQSPAALFGFNQGPALSVDGGNTFAPICGNLDPNTCAALMPRAVDPVTGALVAADTLHLYVSKDRGATWSLIIDMSGNGGYEGFSAIAVGNNVLYAAQRLTHTLTISSGLTTNLAYIAVTPQSPNAYINDIAMDPQDANIVYVAATDGLFVSRDRGASYAQPITGCASVVAAAAAAGSAQTQVYAVLNDCLSPTAWESPTPGFVASVDGGLHWQNAIWGMQPVQPDGGVDRGAGPSACDTSIAPDPSGNGAVYVSLGWCGGVFYSPNGGVN